MIPRTVKSYRNFRSSQTNRIFSTKKQWLVCLDKLELKVLTHQTMSNSARNSWLQKNLKHWNIDILQYAQCRTILYTRGVEFYFSEIITEKPQYQWPNFFNLFSLTHIFHDVFLSSLRSSTILLRFKIKKMCRSAFPLDAYTYVCLLLDHNNKLIQNILYFYF